MLSTSAKIKKSISALKSPNDSKTTMSAHNKEGNFEVMMKCDHYAVITLSVVDDKITLRRCEFMTLSAYTPRKLKERQRISCLITQISCYVMTHIIIIKRGEASELSASVDEVKVSPLHTFYLHFSPSLIHSYGTWICDFLISSLSLFKHRKGDDSDERRWGKSFSRLMILMMIYEFVLKALPCLR